MTPESSEQPRETRDGMPIVELFDRMVEARAEHPTPSWLDESPEVTPERFDTVLKDQRAKVSSPELASLAARYLDFELTYGAPGWTPTLCAKLSEDVRSLAASVLAQAEGNPRK